MTDHILGLNRSAVDIATQWGPDFAAIPARTGDQPGENPFLSPSRPGLLGPASGPSLSTEPATGGRSRTRSARQRSCVNSGHPDPTSPTLKRPGHLWINELVTARPGLRHSSDGVSLLHFRGTREPADMPYIADSEPHSVAHDTDIHRNYEYLIYLTNGSGA